MRRKLTPRELQVLELVSQGYKDKEISLKLVILPQTIKNHLQVIKLKLDASNRVDAVVKAIQSGYIKF